MIWHHTPMWCDILPSYLYCLFTFDSPFHYIDFTSVYPCGSAAYFCPRGSSYPQKVDPGFFSSGGGEFYNQSNRCFLVINIFNASPSFPFVTEHPHIVCINLLHCVLWEYVNVRNMYMIQAFRYIYVFGVTVYMFVFISLFLLNQPRVWNVVGSCLLLMWPTLKTQFYSTSKVIIHEQISKHCHDLRKQT